MMKNPHPIVNDFEQLALTPPPVLRLSLHIGIMRDADHVQAQLELWDESGSELLAMESWPHFDLASTDERMRIVGRRLTEMIRQHTGPFA